ncbi:MAG TPA: methionyl-tRNA formyltransferase [Candidatus Limnocylindrales bacterium]
MTSRAGAGARPARTIFFGSGSFGVPILDALVDAPEVDVVAVVSVPDRAAGRRREPTPVPVAARAAELDLPVLQPATLRSPEAVDAIAAHRPELGVLADFGRIVPGAILSLPPRGILNVHPSLLPRHRGASPIPASILAGDAETGVTLMQMDEGLDTGPVVAVDRWPLDGTETSPLLEARAAEVGARLVRETLVAWLAGEIKPRPQDAAAATMTRPLRREDGRLDADAAVVDLERRVRAMQPWPGTWVETVAGRLTIWRAEAVPGWIGSEHEEPGRFGRFGLHARDGYLALREVQPAGGRRMTFEELVRGRPGIVGSSVIRAPVA